MSGTFGTSGLLFNCARIASRLLELSLESPPPPVRRRIPDLKPDRMPCLGSLSPTEGRPVDRSSSENAKSSSTASSVEIAVPGGLLWFTEGDVADLACMLGREGCRTGRAAILLSENAPGVIIIASRDGDILRSEKPFWKELTLAFLVNDL
jgi:hypothetical protein